MGGPLLLLPLIVLVMVALAAAAVLTYLRRSRAPVGAGSSGQHVGSQADRTLLVHAQRHRLRWRWGGLVVGGALALGVAATASTSTSGAWRALLLAPVALGGAVLVATLAGEHGAQPARGGPRSASIVVRRPRDHLPVPLSVAVVLVGVLLASAATMTTIMGLHPHGPGAGTALVGAEGVSASWWGARPDLTDPAGRLVLSCTPASTWSTRWFGLHETGPFALAVGACLVLAVVAARRTAARPRALLDPADHAAVRADDRLRRRTGEALVAACGVLLSASLVTLAAPTLVGMLGVPACAPQWWPAARWAVGLSVPAGLAVLVWCAAVLLVPARRHDVLVATP